MDAYKNLSLSGKVYLVLALPLVSVALMLFYIASELKAPMGIPMMIALAGCLPGFLLAANLSGYLNSMLEDAAQMVDAIAKGNSTSRFRMSSQDALGRLAYTLQNLQTSVTRMMKSDEGSDSGAAQDAQTTALIKALDVCDTSMMLADADLNIIYMNEAVIRMMSGREKQIQTQLSNFDSRSLIGTCVDDFHQNPSHQRGMLKGLREAYKTDLPLAGLTFGLIATPLYSDSGERLGTVVEWDDKTERLAKEAEEDKISADNLRIKQSLDVCDTSVMVADADLNIIYMNKAVGEMMGDRETQIRTQLSNFDSKSLIGTCVDDFHKNPSHQRGMLKDLKTTYKTDLPLAGLTFGLIATPLYSDSGERLGTVVEWDDKTERLMKEQEEQALAASNARVKQALDSVSANVMIADNDFEIIYMNEAVSGMMRKGEGDIRKDLPSFNANKLVGENIDVFHKNPAHQRSMVSGLVSTFSSEIEVGGRTFGLIANPITVDENRIGTVVEWIDRTDEVSIEKDIDKMVSAANNGDFTQQIDMAGKEGFFKGLSSGLNALVTNVDTALADVLRMLGAMSQGDLTPRIIADYSGSFAQLKEDANTTADKLTEVIGNIRSAASSISESSNEISQGNTDLSQRTEEQASSLEETASSMEEMTSTVKRSEENALEASELSGEAQTKAQEGGEVVSRAVVAMEEINKSSKKIADIIGVIDEIAFQTNLLALNAAVEAARAGEQGRGFAVVAGEVRNLAQRSAAAAKEIKDLIRDSGEKVADGSRLVNDSGSTLKEIVSVVGKVTTMVSEISSAALEQTQGIEQVNTAIAQMDEMTQQNAALVEEATAAGEAMSEQANGMSTMMQFFTVNDGASGASYASAPRGNPAPAKAIRSPMSANGGAQAQAQDDDDWEEF